jgi:hypothetical protein
MPYFPCFTSSRVAIAEEMVRPAVMACNTGEALRVTVAPMITKILFTAAIIAIVMLYAGGKARGRDVAARTPDPGRTQASSPAAESLKTRNLARYLAYALLGVMLAGSGTFLFLQWQDHYRVVSVRVVNTNTGRSESFQARRGDVEDRAFVTLDGRRVVLSGIERLELGGVADGER